MRVLVVDHDSTVLETTVRALRDHFVIDAVTNKADCIDLLRQNEFDIVVACERLEDGSGLELLGQIAKRWPATLRVFAADRERLRLLQGRLGPFELFQALAYPINPEKLLSTLSLAREAHDADADTTSIQHIVLEGENPTEPEPPPPAPPAPSRHSSAATSPRALGRSRNTPERAPPERPPPERAPAPRGVTPAPRTVGRQVAAAPARQYSAVAAPHPSSAVTVSPRRRVTRVAAPIYPSSPDDAAVMSESLAEAAGIAAAARDRYDPAEDHTPAGRKAFIAGAGCAVALVAIGLIVLKLSSKPRPTSATAAPPAPVQAQFSQAVTDQVAQVESDFEQDNFRKAQIDIRRLQELAPEHPRLRFFQSLLDRNVKAHGTLAARERSEAAARPRSESAAAGPSPVASVSKPETPRKAIAATATAAIPARSDAGTANLPKSEDGPVFVAGTPTSSEPLLHAASALPDTSTAPPATAPPATAPPATAPPAVAPSRAAPVNAAPASAGPTVTAPAGAASAGPAAPPLAITASATGNLPSASASASQPISDAPPATSARAPTAPTVTAEAQLTHRVPPQYPESALRSGVQGYVDVHFTITTDGSVSNVSVVSSDPAAVFDRAATDAVRRWRYEPRVVDGRPVASQSQVRLQFKLAQPGLDSTLSH